MPGEGRAQLETAEELLAYVLGHWEDDLAVMDYIVSHMKAARRRRAEPTGKKPLIFAYISQSERSGEKPVYR
jgi:hypothetical protein